MLLPIIGILIGIILGLVLPVHIPTAYSPYMSIAVLAALDSVFGGIRASLEKKFETDAFISGFFGNALLAAGLAYMGIVWMYLFIWPPYLLLAAVCSRILP